MKGKTVLTHEPALTCKKTGKNASQSGIEDNKLKPEDRAAHDWYRFVLSFPPHIVREYLDRFNAGCDSVVLDPFCGTGTTIVECKKYGIPSFGLESNPMAHFASQTKVSWDVSAKELLEHAKSIAAETLIKLKEDGIDDTYGGLPLFGNNREEIELKSLPEEINKLILTDSISPLPLHKALTLIDAIHEQHDERFARYERLALAKALVNGIGNLYFGPEVGVGKKKRDAPVVEIWMRCIQMIAEDLEVLRGLNDIPARALLCDARQAANLLEPKSIDIVFTSPPYPNEKDYTRTTRLESVLLGFVKNKQDLQKVKKSLICSNTRSVYKDDTDDAQIVEFDKILKISENIESRRIEMGKTSGFERLYARVTKLYFGGMAKHLSELRSVLKPGARLAYVVGDQASYLQIMIRTGQLLSEIAESLGYEVESIDLFRTRLATATREMLREEVVVLRWPKNKAG